MNEMNNNYNPAEKIKQYYLELLQSIEEMVLDDFRQAKTTEERKKIEIISNSLNQPNNSIYIEMVALSILIKDTYPSEIKEITLSDLSKHDINYRNKLYLRTLPIMEAVYITGIYSKAINIQSNKPDKELTEYLIKKGFPEIVTSYELEEFKNLLIKILKRKELNEKLLIDAIAIYIMDYTNSNAVNIEFSKSFAKELGYLSNKKIIELYKMFKEQRQVFKTSRNNNVTPEDYVHDFLDMNEVFERFENGEITVEEKQILRPEDYVYKFLQNYYSKKTNATNILDKVKIITLIDMFKTRAIRFEDLYVLLTAPESRFSKCNSKEKERLKGELRKIYIHKKEHLESQEENKEGNASKKHFSSLELLKLAQIGLVDEEDMLGIYASQRHKRRALLQEYKSSKLYEGEPNDILRQYGIISDADMLEYFDEKNLIDMYLKMKESNKFRKKTNKDDFMFPLACTILYIPIQDIETQIITDERIKPEDILFFYEKGIVSDETIKTLTLNDSEFKTEFFNHIRQIGSQPDDKSEKEPSDKIFEYFNRDIINEDDLIEIFDDRYEVILRDAFRKRYIRLDKLKELTFLDNSIVMEEYNNSLNNHLEHPETAEQEQDFKSMLDIYLLTDDLVNFKDIYKIVEERKDPVLQDESFDPIKNIYDTIVNDVAPAFEEFPIFDRNILISKIRELYMNSFLRLDELNMLVDQDIIERDNAKKIDDDFNNSEIIKKIESSELGDSAAPVATLNPNPTPRSTSSGRREPKPPTDRQILQADAMIKFLSSIGFEPKTTTNAFGIEQMDTFDSGDFKDYRIFLSKENLRRVVIMVHLKQLPNTDMYYHVGDNATYLMSSSSFLAYLRSSGVINSALSSFNTTKSNARESKFTKTANVGKFWGKTVPRKICEIMSELDNPELQEMKNKNFEIMSIFPESLMAQDQEARLEQINKCLEELNAVREMNDD